MIAFATAAGMPITATAITTASAGRSPKVVPRPAASGRTPFHIRMPVTPTNGVLAPTCLLESGAEGRLGLAHAEHRLVELRPAVLDLVEVVVVHAADHLLHGSDLSCE